MDKYTTMTRRGFVRLISILTAACVAFAIMAGVNHGRHSRASRQVEYNYLRALENLALSMESIRTTLNRGIYSNSPQMLNELSGRLGMDASTAKMSLSQLPVTQLNLENTNRFLSQVGNYSQSLARKFAGGGELSRDDRANLTSLLEHAERLANELWEIESRVSGGHLSFSEVFGDRVDSNGNGGTRPPHISDGFANMEGIFDDYPSLVYDGPFSEHIISGIEPRLLRNTDAVSAIDSLSAAREYSGVSSLVFLHERGGRIPTYVFGNADTTTAVTQDGGLFVQKLSFRRVGEKTVSMEQAIGIAEDFLAKIGYLESANMVHTYYSLNGGICTIKFASELEVDCHEESNFGDCPIIIYTDLIKVGVALDNGEVVSFDATPFITAHHRREPSSPAISEDEAAQRLSANLEVQNVRLAVIPTSGNNEVLCYEFLCVSDRGSQVLVYVNADTGVEEQILLVRISDNGTIVV
jgi:germination protein YpeB